MAGREPDDIDARFDEIMAGWDLDADLSDRRLPEDPGTSTGLGESLPDEETAEPDAGLAPPAQEQRLTDRWLVYRDPASNLSMGTDHRSWSPGDDPDDEFVPPQPEPVPTFGHDPWWWAILIGLVGGPLVLLTLTLTGNTSPRLYLWLAGLATVAALVGLFWRLPSRDEVDGGDDGARV